MSAKTSHLAHHFDTAAQQQSAATLGMWTFLVTEFMIFGAVLSGYAVYRAAHPRDFAAASHHMVVWVGAVNTAVLLGSSLTMALAVRAAQVGAGQSLLSFLGLTLGLGAIFLAIKATEWSMDYTAALVPGLAFDEAAWQGQNVDVPAVKMFFVFYFTLTGLHALHMVIGMGLLTWLGVAAWRGRFSPGYYTPVEIGGLYWHFVDIVWIFLFPLLYLVGTRHFT